MVGWSMRFPRLARYLPRIAYRVLRNSSLNRDFRILNYGARYRSWGGFGVLYMALRHSDGVFQLHILPSAAGLRCSHCAFLFEGRQWALRSCGSPSVALQPMLCPRGLAPFFRPAIRGVQTAQELQIVRGAVLGFEEECLHNCIPPPQACWCQSMALKMASVRWDDGWRSLPPAPLPPGGLARSRAGNVPWSPGRIVSPHMLHAVHPALGHVNASQIICSAGHQNASFGAGQDRAALGDRGEVEVNAWFGAPPPHTAKVP